MPITRDMLDQLRHVLRPIATRVANTVARGVVQLVNDGTKQQLLQLGVLAGETIDNAEHFHPYGFSSVPEPGAEVVVVFPNGDRSHPLVIATSDRRYRPTGGDPADVRLYAKGGAKFTLRAATGDIEIQPGPSGQVFIRAEGGETQRLVTVSEFNGHTHPAAGDTGGLAAPPGGGMVTGATGAPSPVDGTQRLQAQ